MNIRTKMFIVLVSLVTISITVVAYLGLNSVITAGSEAQKITSATLQDQAEEILTHLTKLVAEKNGIALERIRKDASNVASYAENIFENPEAFARDAYWKFDQHVFKGEGGQYLNGEDDISSVFIPNHVNIDDDLKKSVELTAYLDFIFPKVLENNPNAVAIWMVGHQGDEARYYPNIGLGIISVPNERINEDIFFAVANPENNPERKVVWTPVYDDPAGQGLMITASAPVYTKQKGFFGVLGIDITLKEIAKVIEKYNPIESSYSFLIDKKGRAIAFPNEAYEDILGRKRKTDEYGTNLSNITNEFSAVLDKMERGSTGFDSIRINNKELYVAYTNLNETDFSLGIVVEKSAMLKAVSTLQEEINNSVQTTIYKYFLPIGALILFVSCILAFFFSESITSPIKKLTKNIGDISMGKLDVEINPKLKESKDEIGALARAFDRTIVSLKLAMRQTAPELKKESESLRKTIEEQKKTEEALRSSEERLKILFEYAPDGIFLYDLKGNFVDGNKAAEDLVGYKREELIGKNFLKIKLIAKEQIPQAAKMLTENALGKSTGPEELTLVRKDDSKVTAEIRTFPVKIKDQSLILGIARDVSKRKETEKL